MTGHAVAPSLPELVMLEAEAIGPCSILDEFFELRERLERIHPGIGFGRTKPLIEALQFDDEERQQPLADLASWLRGLHPRALRGGGEDEDEDDNEDQAQHTPLTETSNRAPMGTALRDIRTARSADEPASFRALPRQERDRIGQLFRRVITVRLRLPLPPEIEAVRAHARGVELTAEERELAWRLVAPWTGRSSPERRELSEIRGRITTTRANYYLSGELSPEGGSRTCASIEVEDHEPVVPALEAIKLPS